MNKISLKNNSVTKIMGPMIAIAMEFDAIIGKLLREKFNIALADFKILRALQILESCTQLDISRFNQVSEAAVSKRIKSLLDKGLIKKQISTEDKRKSILTLTAKGKALMSRLQSEVIKNAELILSDFSKADRNKTAGLLINILRMVAKHSPNRDKLIKSRHPALKLIKKCNTK